MPVTSAKPGKILLDPNDHVLIMIDHQSQMSFATKSIDAVTLRNNAALVRELSVSVLPRVTLWRLNDYSLRQVE